MPSLPECIPWMTVGLAESVAIVTLNLCTIIVFTKCGNFCRRSTYLVINLAVIDMLPGGSAMYQLFYMVGTDCNVWNEHRIEDWGDFLIRVIIHRFGISNRQD